MDVRIPLAESTKELLIRQPTAKEKNGYVFPGKNGAMRSGANGVARRLADEAGLPRDFRPFHGIRHYTLTELVCSGVDIDTVRRMAGHKDISTTVRYLEGRGEKMKDAADILGRNISNVSNQNG